ncbi:hypothetical protein [Dyadobacter sp. NIV53]|uniref:hypothetical protein n=1 Tax=Dyadobacter sp. NIV53 TaxID=2861765 RepID=UPI001C87B151|nr:hypothetical protein [Dyadobacter sp. NIV53]
MKGEHILHNLNPFGKDLKNHIEYLVGVLPARLGIPISELNFTEDSIYALDTYLSKIQKEIDEKFVNENVIPLTVYLNEIFVRANGGEWFMEFDEDTWQPVILTRFGERRQYFSYIYENLMYDEVISINSCYFSGGSPA